MRQLKLAVGFMLAALVGSAGPAAADSMTPAHLDRSKPLSAPVYPDRAQTYGMEGTVTVEVYVNSRGRIKNARIKRSSGFNDLDLAAVETVMNWPFVPATKEGSPEADWASVDVVYKLPKAAPASETKN